MPFSFSCTSLRLIDPYAAISIILLKYIWFYKQQFHVERLVLKKQIRVSVGELVAFSCRSGDLELSRIVFPRSRDPIKIHQMIQKSRPAEYAADVMVSHTVETDCFFLNIGGRIDGVYTYPNRT